MPVTYDAIASTTLTGTATNIDFTSIPQTYTDLRIVMTPFTDSSNMYIISRINNSTSSLYSQIYYYTTEPNTIGISATVSQSSYITSYAYGAETSSNGWRTVQILDYMNYANTSKTKTAFFRSNMMRGSTGSVEMHVATFNSTAAITRITLLPQSGNLQSGTVATLFGIKRA